MVMLITYSDGTRMEDVQEMIMYLTPTETPLLTGMAKVRAIQTLHEWIEDTITIAQDNAVPEGASFGDPVTGVGSRRTNITQIFEKVWQTSSTMGWIKSYGRADHYSEEQMKAMKGIGTDIELAILRGSKAVGNGAGASARRMAGIYNYVTTLASTVASGTKLTESLFNDALEAMIDQTDGAPMDEPIEVYVPMRLKRVISTYTANNERNIASDDRRLVAPVDVYESEVGLTKIFYHRRALKTTNSDATCLFCRRPYLKLAIGEEVHVLPKDEVAQTQHARKGVIRGEMTLEVHGESHMNQLIGLDTSFPA